MKARRSAILAMGVGLLFSQVSAAQSAGSANMPEVLSEAKETELALSAAPEHLRSGAGVYVLTATGYQLVRQSTNKFTCIVNRDHPLAIKPTCFDEEGTATIIPKILRVGELMMQGKSPQEIAADIKAGFETGRFISPRRPGIAYMLSGDIRNVGPGGRISSFPPHVMFYAPNLTPADIGADGTPGLPIIGYQGPQGYMILPVDTSGIHAHDAPTPARVSNPVTDAARVAFPEHQKNLIGAFAAMPEAKYGFRPTAELMTFGELAVHIAGANVFYCRRLGGAAPGIAFPKPTAPKAQLVKVLEDSLSYCAPIVAGLTDAALEEAAQVQQGAAPTKASVVLDLLSGMDHHYGQAAGYLRLNNVLPPTAVRGKH